MRDAWHRDVESRARAYWTPERTHGLLGSKNLLFPPCDYGPLLRAMCLTKADGSMGPESVRKYMQITHMLALLEPQLRDLAQIYPTVRILDLACGNSYLSLLAAMSFRRRLSHPTQILGVDRNTRLVEACKERSFRLFLDDSLKFESSQLDSFNLETVWESAYGPIDSAPPVHMLLALHACNTATDDAIALGIAKRVPAMAIVPCCQSELAKAWTEMAKHPSTNPLFPLWNWPHLRRETASTLTDALRCLLLKGCGYDATPLEFVPSSHTPKNTMIRANLRSPGSVDKFQEYLRLRRSLGEVRLNLELILPEPHLARLKEAEQSRSRVDVDLADPASPSSSPILSTSGLRLKAKARSEKLARWCRAFLHQYEPQS